MGKKGHTINQPFKKTYVSDFRKAFLKWDDYT